MPSSPSLAFRALVAPAIAFVPLSSLAADDIVVGASIPLSGPLAGFGRADHEHVMEYGRFALSGSAQQVRDNPRLRQLYIGTADGGTDGAPA
jgi:hypothetical protein